MSDASDSTRSPLRPPQTGYVQPTEQELIFVEAVTVSCLHPLEAATAAGYPDPPNDVRRLFSRPNVVRAIIAKFQAEHIPFKALVEKALKTLWRNMDSEDAKIGGDAAKTVIGAAKRADMPLMESAALEDAVHREQLVREVLGENTPVQSHSDTEQAPTEEPIH